MFAADFLRLRYGEGGEGQWDAKPPHIVPRARTLWTLAKGFGEALDLRGVARKVTANLVF